MKFINAEDQETHPPVRMEERNGLWYPSNSILMPPTSAEPTKQNLGASNPLRINKLATGTEQMVLTSTHNHSMGRRKRQSLQYPFKWWKYSQI